MKYTDERRCEKPEVALNANYQTMTQVGCIAYRQMIITMERIAWKIERAFVRYGNCRRKYRNLNPVMKKSARVFIEKVGTPA